MGGGGGGQPPKIPHMKKKGFHIEKKAPPPMWIAKDPHIEKNGPHEQKKKDFPPGWGRRGGGRASVCFCPPHPCRRPCL